MGLGEFHNTDLRENMPLLSNGRKIVLFGTLITLTGMVLCGYHLMIWDMINGRWPDIGGVQIGLGSFLMMIGPWVIKARNTIKRGVE